MIEVAGGIILAVIFLAFLPLIVAAIVFIGPLVLGIASVGLALVALLAPLGEPAIVLCMAAFCAVVAAIWGYALLRGLRPSAADEEQKRKDELARLERLVDFKADHIQREKEAQWSGDHSAKKC